MNDYKSSVSVIYKWSLVATNKNEVSYITEGSRPNRAYEGFLSKNLTEEWSVIPLAKGRFLILVSVIKTWGIDYRVGSNNYRIQGHH